MAGRLDELRQWAEAATWREVAGLVDVRFIGGGLIGGKLIVDFLHQFGMTGAIESYSKRYAAVATTKRMSDRTVQARGTISYLCERQRRPDRPPPRATSVTTSARIVSVGIRYAASASLVSFQA